VSFSYNPLRHFDVVKDDVGWYQAVCHGCGGEVGSKFDATTAISVFEQAMVQHIRSSHGRTEDDFEGWPQR
jgi:hypothetical protein